MFQFRKIAAIAAIASLPAAAFGASVTFQQSGPILPATSPMNVATSGGGDSLTTTFSWDGVPEGGRSGSVEFEVDGAFDLFLTGYTDLQTDDFQSLNRLLISAGILEKINSSGEQVELYEGNASGASCALAGPECFIVSGPGSYTVGSIFDELIDIAYRPDASTPIISVDEGGLFRLTGAESNNPITGFMTFEIRARDVGVVPLPAGLPLLLGGLGLLGLASRRRR